MWTAKNKKNISTPAVKRGGGSFMLWDCLIAEIDGYFKKWLFLHFCSFEPILSLERFPVQPLLNTLTHTHTFTYFTTCSCKPGTGHLAPVAVHFVFNLQPSLGKDDLWERDNGHIHLGAQPLWIPDGVHHASCVRRAVHPRPFPARARWVLVPRVFPAVSLIPLNFSYEFM